VTLAALGRLAAIGLLAAHGCGQDAPAAGDDSYAGAISGDWRARSGLRVAYGRHWAIAGDAVVDAAGAFRIPASARAVVAYLDANHNGRFDRFAEPSGDCRLTGRAWTCSIEPRRTTLHRSITRRAGDHNDKTYVFWEDFAPDGSPVPGSQLCVENRCTSLESPPFVSRSDARVQVLSICGESGFAPVDAKVRGLAHELAVPLARPADLAATLTIEAASDPRNGDARGDLRVHIAAPVVDRALVWAGQIDPRSGQALRIYWTSEDGLFELAGASGGMAARLPAAGVEQCRLDPDCEIVVQLLAYGSPPGAPLVAGTELRSTMAFRRLP
jgi:hypothetical protein